MKISSSGKVGGKSFSKTIAFGLVCLALSLTVAQAKMTAQQQKYFDLLKGKMITTEAGLGSSGAKSGETKVGGVDINITIPGMGNVADASSKQTVHLCSDGSYIFNQVDSAGNIKSTTREAGRWSIGKADAALFVLVLTPKKQAVKNWALSFDGERTMVNDERWYRMKSSACK
jgi:hypothetical protein